ncbi:MAG: Wzz/FepE/Etk N-terminal domain-containing protein [Planctomycetota bacterium]
MSQSNLPAPVGQPSAPAASSRPEIVEVEPALTLFEILARNKGKMIACAAVMLLLGAIYQLTADKVYQSTAEVFIEPNQYGESNSPLAPGGISAGLPSTHARIMESVPVLLRALETPAVAESQTMSEFEDSGRRLRHMQKEISVGYSKESEIVTVSFPSKVPEEAEAITRAIVNAYLHELRVEIDQPAAAEGVEAVDGPRGVMDDEMIASSLMKLSEQMTLAQVELEAAEIRVAEADQAAGNLATLSSLLAEAGLNAQVHGLAEIAYLKAELARLDQQLEGMPDAWGPSHKIRGPVQRQADALRYEVGNLTHNARHSMANLLKSNRVNASKRVDELSARIAQQQSLASQVAELPVKVYQWPYVPDKHIKPTGAKSMGIALVLGLGLGLVLTLRSEMKRPAAVGVSSSTSRSLDVRDTTPQAAGLNGSAPRALPNLMKGEDFAIDTGRGEPTPMLGVVPEVPAGSRLTSPNFDATASSIHQIRAVLQVQARSQDTKAYAFTSPRRGAGKTSVAIGVASSLAMSGTRTLVVDCDLAGRISRGQTGAPAPGSDNGNGVDPKQEKEDFFNGRNNGALDKNSGGDRFGPIDEDGSSAENPSLDNIVIEQGYVSEDDSQQLATNTTGAVGITGVLDGAALQDCVVEATVSGLWLLPAVNAQTRHIGKMSDAFIRDVMDQAKDHYDLVLFDTGPVPGSVEALLVTSQVDGVVLVVPQGEARSALDRTISYLKVVGATVTGTVFNRVAEAKKPEPSSPLNSSVGGATAAAAAAGETHRNGEPVNGDMLVELEKEQKETDDDGEYLAGDAPLGSGILAAAVFSDADSEYESQDWKLEETSGDFTGSVDELFGSVNGEKNDAAPNENGKA